MRFRVSVYDAARSGWSYRCERLAAMRLQDITIGSTILLMGN